MLKDIGAEGSTSCARTPQQNGISEKTNRTLLDLSRTCTLESGLHQKLWAESISFCNQILNVITIHKVENKSPFEIIYGRKPYLGHIQPFGSKCCILDQTPNKEKMEPRSIDGVLVGLNDVYSVTECTSLVKYLVRVLLKFLTTFDSTEKAHSGTHHYRSLQTVEIPTQGPTQRKGTSTMRTRTPVVHRKKYQMEHQRLSTTKPVEPTHHQKVKRQLGS